KDAVEKAHSGDTIEIRSDGPFLTEAVNLGTKALAIRAGERFVPVLLLKPEITVPMIRTAAPLTIEGIEFQRQAPDEKGGPYHAISAFGSSVRLAHCRISAKGDGSGIDSGSAEI